MELTKLSQNLVPANSLSEFFHLTVKWVYYCPLDGLWFLDFYREKGWFSNYKFHNIRHKLHSATGLEWSPNNRFLYISSRILCFNTIPGWKTWLNFWKIGRYLGRIKWSLKTVFAKCSLGPDCRIYMSSLSSKIHPCHQQPGWSRPFVILYNTISLSTTGTKSMPYLPNYRLDSGPVCDPTITIPKISLMFLY